MPRGRPRKKLDTKPLVAGEEEIVEQEVVPVNEEERQQWEEWVQVWGPGYTSAEYIAWIVIAVYCNFGTSYF